MNTIYGDYEILSYRQIVEKTTKPTKKDWYNISLVTLIIAAVVGTFVGVILAAVGA